MAQNFNDEIERGVKDKRLKKVRDKKEKVNWGKNWSKKENWRSDQF